MITRAHAALKKYTSWSQFFAQERSYRTLRAHYASAHWRPWFDQPPAQGERPRRQRWPTGCFFNWPPSEDVSSLRNFPVSLYVWGGVQFQLDYFDFRLLNFHLMTSLQCWRIFWHFQISRLTQLGAECDLCKEKLYGDDKKMVEHYATIRSSSDHHWINIRSSSGHLQIIIRWSTTPPTTTSLRRPLWTPSLCQYRQKSLEPFWNSFSQTFWYLCNSPKTMRPSLKDCQFSK